MRSAAWIGGCAFGLALAGSFVGACVSDDSSPSPEAPDASPGEDVDANAPPSGLDSGEDTGVLAVDASDATVDSGQDAQDASDSGSIVDAGPDTATADAAPAQIVTNLGTFLYSLTASGGYLYWVGQGNETISRCAASNCAATVTTLYHDAFSIEALAVDATRVYFTEQNGTNGGAMYSVPIDADGGVAPTYLASGLSDPLGIAVDATGLYFTQYTNAGDTNDGVVTKCDPADCLATAVPITGQTFADSLALNATTVFWAGEGNPGSTGYVHATSKAFDAGVVTIGSPEPNAALLTIDSTNVYFVAFDSSNVALVRFCPLGGCDGGADLLSTTPTQLGNFGPRIASDGARVYFLNGNGSVVEECPVTGCNGAATTFATLPGGSNGSSIALDANNVYVAATGSIFQIAK